MAFLLLKLLKALNHLEFEQKKKKKQTELYKVFSSKRKRYKIFCGEKLHKNEELIEYEGNCTFNSLEVCASGCNVQRVN